MRFWDTSAVFPLCHKQGSSSVVRSLADEDFDIVAWWGTLTECQSALARLRREGRMSAFEERQVSDAINTLASAWIEVQPVNGVRRLAHDLLRRYPLRAADALQLAAAKLWAGQGPEGHEFVCLDQRLRNAAFDEGFSVLPLAEPDRDELGTVQQ